MTDDKDDKGIFQSMKRHPIFAGCAIMLLLMLCLGGACMMGLVTKPAQAAVLGLDIPYCKDYTWDANKKTVKCVPADVGPVDPPIPPPVGDVCVSGDVRINNGWGNPTIVTSDYGNFGNNVVAVKVAPPSGTTGTNQRTSSWAEYGGPRVVREAAFSNVACSFAPADALKNSAGLAFISKDQLTAVFVYRIGDAGTSTAGLTAGQTYYINIRNRYGDGTPSCPQGGCTMRGNLPE